MKTPALRRRFGVVLYFAILLLCCLALSVAGFLIVDYARENGERYIGWLGGVLAVGGLELFHRAFKNKGQQNEKRPIR